METEEKEEKRLQYQLSSRCQTAHLPGLVSFSSLVNKGTEISHAHPSFFANPDY